MTGTRQGSGGQSHVSLHGRRQDRDRTGRAGQRRALHQSRLRSQLPEHHGNKRIYIEAIRTIQPGEELAYDYQIDRDGDDPPTSTKSSLVAAAPPNAAGACWWRARSRAKIRSRSGPRRPRPRREEARREDEAARQDGTRAAPRRARREAPWRGALSIETRPRTASAALRTHRTQTPWRLRSPREASRSGRLRAAALVRGLIDCAHRRRDRGEFQAARIGAQRQLRLRERIRGDRTCWLEEPVFAEERSLLHELEQVRLRVNRADIPGAVRHRGPLCVVSAGAGYARHLDNCTTASSAWSGHSST